VALSLARTLSLSLARTLSLSLARTLSLTLAPSLALTLTIRWRISRGLLDPSAQQHSSSTTTALDRTGDVGAALGTRLYRPGCLLCCPRAQLVGFSSSKPS
jgi:hypothetical protein